MTLNTKLLSRCWLPLLLILAGCNQNPAPPGMKLGKPYMVDGKSYYPEYDPTYDKIGMASWYGPGFHGKYTASGEIFNQNDLTAAHPTLPMPALVRVTNLSNGKSLIVRINDRGPFKSNRIIDLSKRAAHELGISSTSEVRVQFLRKETEDYVSSLQNNGTKPDMFAYNAQAANDRDASMIHSTEPSDQIMESTISNSHVGQTVNDAAPIVTVNSGELKKAEAAPATGNSASPIKPGHGFIAKAYADENIPAPEQVQNKTSDQDAGANNAPPAKTSLPNVSQQQRKGKVAVSGNTPGTFYIQAGSFSAEENARKLSTKLDGLGKLDIAKVDMGEKSWWRVRLGPFESQQDANEVLDKVHMSGLPDARVVHQ